MVFLQMALDVLANFILDDFIWILLLTNLLLHLLDSWKHWKALKILGACMIFVKGTLLLKLGFGSIEECSIISSKKEEWFHPISLMLVLSFTLDVYISCHLIVYACGGKGEADTLGGVCFFIGVKKALDSWWDDRRPFRYFSGGFDCGFPHTMPNILAEFCTIRFCMNLAYLLC